MCINIFFVMIHSMWIVVIRINKIAKFPLPPPGSLLLYLSLDEEHEHGQKTKSRVKGLDFLNLFNP